MTSTRSRRRRRWLAPPPRSPPELASDRRLRLHLADIAADVGGRLRVGGSERFLHPGHVVISPLRELVVDRAEELERRRQPDVGDGRMIAADEPLAVDEEGAV